MGPDSHHDHHHAHGKNGSQRILLTVLVLTAMFSVIEAVAGWISGSLALLGDAGHMLTDSAALGIGAFAAWLSRKPPSERHSYGLQRAETLGALLNITFMLAIAATVIYEAVERLREPRPVAGLTVIAVAALGLLINSTAARLLHRGEQTLNVKGALLHVIGDLLGSVAALVAGLVIWWTGWTPIDPVLSVFISLLILGSSFKVLADVVLVLMEGVPSHLNLADIDAAMSATAGVHGVHDLHVWSISSNEYALSAHVNLHALTEWHTVLDALNNTLNSRFGLRHTTLQPEITPASQCVNQSCGPETGRTNRGNPSEPDAF
jgi:cobalt-zinc-cadmium efflux system protein